MTDRPSRSTFHSRLYQMVSELREQIGTGERKSGSYLPSVSDLANMYRLSRNSVRKGLDALKAEGLLRSVPRVGNQVVAPVPSATVTDNITLRFGYHPSLEQEADLLQLVTDFQRLYPGIHIQMIKLTTYDNYVPTIKSYLDQQLLDVMTINFSEYDQFAAERCLDVFQEYDDNPELYSFLTRPMMTNGKLYVRPFVFSPVVLCYNRQHFREYHLQEPDGSWKWDDLLQTAGKLADSKGRYGFYFHLMSMNRWPVFLLQSDSQFERGESGTYKICDTNLQKGFSVCRDVIYSQGTQHTFLSESDADAEALFMQGRASMIMTTYFGLNQLRKAQFEYDIAPLPSFIESNTLLLAVGLAVNRKSTNRSAAELFASYLLSYEAQLQVRRRTLSLPAYKIAAEWYGEETLQRPTRFLMFRDIAHTFRFFSDLNLHFRDLSVIRRELKLFWSRMENESDVCRRLEQLL